MINQRESEQIKGKFLTKLREYIRKDEKERNLVLALMVSCFIVALIFTIISSVMIYISFKKSVKAPTDSGHRIEIVEGESTNE